MLVAAASLAGVHDGGPAIAPGGVARAGAPAPDAASHEVELARLRALEDQRRREIDFAAAPPSDVALGPDPYRIAALPGGQRLVGLLRGESAAVVLDAGGAERSRVAAPRSPGGLAVSAGGDVLVVGEAARELAHYRLRGDRLDRVATLPVDALGMRDVALAPDGRTAYVVEDHDGRLLAVTLRPGRGGALRSAGARELSRCHGPIQVAAVRGHVAVDCLLDHAIEIRRDGGELVRIRHDGPIWRFALRPEPDGGLLIAAGGVEDHPLEREDGGFGYIDSYVYLYRLAPGATEPTRLAAINSSALGVVTPKWIAFGPAGAGAVSVTVAGYASPRLVTLTWRGDPAAPPAAPPEVATTELVPGASAAARAGDGALIAADPLLDAWVVERGGALRVVPVAGARPARPVLSRIGELLFFTTLMSPWNSSDGKLSRFTCETCHHEGYVDGRVHYTGRGRVFAATRPLYGLGNLRPYFSRALDETMTDMVHAEFRVANRHNGRDPWFALTRADAPWLAHVAERAGRAVPGGAARGVHGVPRRLHPPREPRGGRPCRGSPRASRPAPRCSARAAPGVTRRAWSPTIRPPRCAFERWEPLVLSASGPIVWSNAAYAKTGVEPYVYDRGARVAPLRRLYKKWPYFTNGSARSLGELLERFAWGPAGAHHDGAPTGSAGSAGSVVQRLTAEDRAALLAFLDLL